MPRITGFRGVPQSRPSEYGFTVTELLIAMALIVFVMSILSAAFSSGLETFDELDSVGDLPEQLRSDAFALTEAVRITEPRAREFIRNSLETRTVNHDEATALRSQYETICSTAADLEVQLREVQRHIRNPDARRVLQRSLDALERLKFSAATMVRLLRLFE